jgi:hypothetical protein
MNLACPNEQKGFHNAAETFSHLCRETTPFSRVAAAVSTFVLRNVPLADRSAPQRAARSPGLTPTADRRSSCGPSRICSTSRKNGTGASDPSASPRQYER